jgi:hypothetical protein
MATAVNPKVTAATAGATAAALLVALVEWIGGVDVPSAVEVPFYGLATFLPGYIKSSGKRVREDA